MMKVYLDTNILVDILSALREHHEESLTILKLSSAGIIQAVMSTQSINDASYISIRSTGGSPESFKESIRKLLPSVELVSIDKEDIEWTNGSDIPDYEDATHMSCAKRNGCDVIVTNDRKFIGSSPLPALTPGEFVFRIGGRT